MNEKIKKDLEELKEILLSDFDSHNTYEHITNSMGLDIQSLNDQFFNQKVPLEYSSETGVELGYAYPSDSGFDLYASEEVYLSPFGRALVPTGIRINIPQNHEIQVRSKSGLAINKGLMVLNSPGTVDQGYTGEIKVIIFNATNFHQTIEKGTKIAQAVLSNCISGKWVDLIKVENIDEKDRGHNGFGSTGI